MTERLVSLNDFAQEVHRLARDNGFYEREEEDSFIGYRLALIHSEVSEVLEAYREDAVHKMDEELADIIIRVLDVCAFMGVDIDFWVSEKHEKNKQREKLHGKVR